jgi:hypothetical protein
MMKLKNTAAILVAGLLAAGLAQAQSHSVANYSNPPGTQADSKAATDATPGLSATAERQDANHAAKNTPSGKTRKPKAALKAKAGAEEAMQRDPSELTGSEPERHAFDKVPAKR